MKTLLAQINTTPNDFSGNVKKISDVINYYNNAKYDLIVFPELAVPGYLCKDMMFRKGFVEQNLDAIKTISKLCVNDTTVVLGYIDRNFDGSGKPFRNMAAIIKNERVIATYQKHLLPFYDVFDEGRYFEPGKSLTVVEIAGKKWGICICEDIWNDKGIDDYNYQFNPLEEYRKRGIIDIISINSSPYVRGKPTKRADMIRKSAERGTIIYCNQYGGQDELVFDGNSFVIHDMRKMLSTSEFINGTECITVDGAEQFKPYYKWTAEFTSYNPTPYNMLKLGLSDYLRKTGFKQVVVGSSGGIDSAVVISLACDAIGPENVHAIRMPTDISSDHSKNDAKQLHDNLGCHDYIVPVDHNPFIRDILYHLGKHDPKPIASENIQARLRGLILMYYSNAFDALLLSTGNKTELALGYCTLYGDMNGGFCPINDLYKMQVYETAKYINREKEIIPVNIINKAPSAELAVGQTDEASLLPYPILDAIVKGYVEEFIGDFKSFKKYASNLDGLLKFINDDNNVLQYDRMIRLINVNEFKRRQAAPGIKMTPVAFGIGRRLPICHGR